MDEAIGHKARFHPFYRSANCISRIYWPSRSIISLIPSEFCLSFSVFVYLHFEATRGFPQRFMGLQPKECLNWIVVIEWEGKETPIKGRMNRDIEGMNRNTFKLCDAFIARNRIQCTTKRSSHDSIHNDYLFPTKLKKKKREQQLTNKSQCVSVHSIYQIELPLSRLLTYPKWELTTSIIAFVGFVIVQ